MINVSAQDGMAEIFYTLQGEGRWIGYPVTFLRLAGCNLHCWWCDTPYTWNWEGTNFEHKDGKKFKKEKEIIALEAPEIAQLIKNLPPRRLVISGGEPLLQQGKLIELLDLLPDFHIEIETNGTMIPTPELCERVDGFNSSPKLSNSRNILNYRNLAELGKNPKYIFKFVVCEPKDLDEILALIENYSLPKESVILMAEGRTEDEQSAASWVAEEAIKHGFRFTPRLHVQLWGAKRGV